jgi:signal transduction histidine kinase/CheY-like chemotaxis protein
MEHSVFSLSRRLENDRQFNGVAQVAISTDYLVGLWASATPDASDIVTLFTADGVVLAQSDSQSQAHMHLPSLGKDLIKQIGPYETGVLRGPLSVGGLERVTIYSKLLDYPVFISLSLNKSAILTTWYANLMVYGMVAATTTVGIMLALGIALRRAREERRATGLWQAEIEERERTQEQLRQSQKMESLGKLTGGIAHDFNNLLTVIIGNISLMKPPELGSNNERLRQNALKASQSATALTQRLLTFARKQVLQPQCVDLLQLVKGMEALLLRTLGPDVQLEVSADPDQWPALVDPNQIEMVILNLAINASDAMPKGGVLSIRASNEELGRTGPRGLASGQYSVLTISDTGTGMDEATLARATEPFFSTKEPGKGTGLGLSMMQGLIAQSGGATRLHSVVDHGTRIELWLPRAHVLPGEIKRQKVCWEKHDNGAILVCDDDPAVLELVSDSLGEQGYEVLPVTNGRAALSALEEHEAIRLLVVDFTMPEMNGAAVVRAVRRGRPGLPILLITGNSNPEAIQADLPEIAMLYKPFTPAQLTDRIADLLQVA